MSHLAASSADFFLKHTLPLFTFCKLHFIIFKGNDGKKYTGQHLHVARLERMQQMSPSCLASRVALSRGLSWSCPHSRDNRGCNVHWSPATLLPTGPRVEVSTKRCHLLSAQRGLRWVACFLSLLTSYLNSFLSSQTSNFYQLPLGEKKFP